MLLDWQMPEMDGVELAFAIQKEFGKSAPPMIMLSSGASSAREAFGGGLNPLAAILAKPIRRQQLHRTIGQVLSGTSATPNRLLGQDFRS